MKTSRLEAFSDGVLAIIITIMVLELSVPNEVTLSALMDKLPGFLSYLFSFIYIGIYWNNHHHLLQITERVNGKILWANLNLLFWLSLIPFTTAWIGNNHIEQLPVVAYGFILLFCAISYFILQGQIINHHGNDFPLKKLIGSDRKGKISVTFYSLGIALTFLSSWLGIACYIFVAILWLIPDKRIEENF